MLRTRPGFHPASNLPALYLSARGIPVRRPTHLPSATLRLRQAGYGLCPVFVSYYRTAPISSRALPGTQPHFSGWLKSALLILAVFYRSSGSIDSLDAGNRPR